MKAKTKRNLLITLADKNYVEQAKQLFSSVYWNAGWKGEYMLLAHEIPEEKLKWFRKKGILVKKCRPLYNEEIRGWPITVLSKFYLFTPYFKKWKNIIYLDADIIVRGSLDELTKIKGFAAVRGWNHIYRLFMTPLEIKIRQINKRILDELKENYDLKEIGFNSGVMAFSTDIIKKDSFLKSKRLFETYGKIGYGDEPIPNLFFYKKWIKLPIVYNINPYYLIKVNNIKPMKVRGIILHFYGHKPWNPTNYFYKEWKDNLNKVESINLKKILAAREKWSEEDIKKYCLYLQKRRILYYHKHIIWKTSFSIDKIFGLLGIFLKNNFPKLYYFLKNEK